MRCDPPRISYLLALWRLTDAILTSFLCILRRDYHRVRRTAGVQKHVDAPGDISFLVSPSRRGSWYLTTFSAASKEDLSWQSILIL